VAPLFQWMTTKPPGGTGASPASGFAWRLSAPIQASLRSTGSAPGFISSIQEAPPASPAAANWISVIRMSVSPARAAVGNRRRQSVASQRASWWRRGVTCVKVGSGTGSWGDLLSLMLDEPGQPPVAPTARRRESTG
jgi:hypothetical protein